MSLQLRCKQLELEKQSFDSKDTWNDSDFVKVRIKPYFVENCKVYYFLK